MIKQLSTDYTTLCEEITDYLGKTMLILCGKCSAVFDGRIKSELTLADRLLVIKKDSTILLHADNGAKPVQWQLPYQGEIKFSIIDNQLRMETYRPKTDETFFITFDSLEQVTAYYTKDISESTTSGDEKDLNLFLAAHPQFIEDQLTIIAREYEIPYGYIDLLAKDAAGTLTVIELKKQAANVADAQQLHRYCDYFITKEKKTVRGILVAAAIPEKVIHYLQHHNFEYKEINWQQIFPTVQRPKFIKKTVDLTKFFNSSLKADNSK